MRICIAQIRIKAAALEENFRSIESAILQAQQERADLIVLPEMAVPGYFVGDAWERPSFLKRCEELNHRIASNSATVPIVFGSVGIDPSARNEDGRVRKYNAAFIAQNGRLLENSNINLPFWPKTLLPNYREFDDSRHFFDLRKLASERNVPVNALLRPVSLDVPSGRKIRIGIGVCEDAWADDYSVKPYDLITSTNERPDVLINISCSPFTAGKQERRRRLFSRIAAEKNCPLVYVNAVGSQNVGKTIYAFDGDSGIYTPGAFDSVGSAFEANTRTLSIATNVRPAQQPTTTNINQQHPRCAELQNALESTLTFIKDEWKLERVVVGVSGGIDSALSAVLHARVFGAKNVFCLNMPSQFNSTLTINAAQKLALTLGCPFASLGIDDAVRLTLKQLTDARAQGFPILDPLPSLVQENVQARDRGARILASVAASLGAIFPCNANKSELTVGYSTLYGDHAGYLAPIADLWKSDVYALARHYNDHVFLSETIPEETLQVVPSAELSSEQDVLQGKGDPLCYPYHDAIFRLWVEEWNRMDFESTLAAFDNGTLATLIGSVAFSHMTNLFKNREQFRQDLQRWWNAYSGMGAFKRMQAPPVLAVTRRAFGFDHRECIGARP